MQSIFVSIPSYADPDLPRTIDSVIRSSSGQHSIHISVAEQVTRYAEAYALDRRLDEHVVLDVASVGGAHLLGLGGARNLAETRYNGEHIQVQVDSHARFDSDWDIAIYDLLATADERAVISSYRSSPWAYPGSVPVCRFDRIEGGIPRGFVDMVDPDSGRLDQLYPARTVLGGAVVGRAWCDTVPADPHILFSGEEPALAARLWTHGRTLWHGRLPWYQADAGGERCTAGSRARRRPGASPRCFVEAPV